MTLLHFVVAVLLVGVISLFVDLGAAKKYDNPNKEQEKLEDYWFDLGRIDIEQALNRPIINNVARNVILFLGDGMGITATTAGRIFKGQRRGKSGEEESLVWEKFPNLSLLKTYNLDKQVPESAATATAFFGGVKGNFHTVGLNGKVVAGDCEASLNKDNHVSSILKWCQDAGKDTGFVTTTRLTHATPAVLYAHSPHRFWECDKNPEAPKDITGECKDIARQFVEDLPGRKINVVFAGGRRQMGDYRLEDVDKSCLRNDSRNLTNEWLQHEEKIGRSSRYVTNTQELRQIDLKNVDFILGLFAGGHLPFNYLRDEGPNGIPSLKELTERAILRLQRNPVGFFLMVEGGRIDHGLHRTKPLTAFEEMLAFEEAVEAALKLTDSKETLIIVTADHSHVMTMNGYPERGNDILGVTKYQYATDNMPFTTLMFTNGPGANFTINNNKVLRSNLTDVDTTVRDFMPQAAVPTLPTKETHGGEDVAAYAVGPMSHLFHRVHEQTYVAHVMGYAACVGPFADSCARHTQSPENLYDIQCQSSSSRAGPLPCGLIAILTIARRLLTL